MTPLVDLGVYCLALLGLTTFMGLESWAPAGVRDGLNQPAVMLAISFA